MIMKDKKIKIAIIGAGNGGQAMAAHFALLGHHIMLYNRNLDKITPIIKTHEINLSGKIIATARIDTVSDQLNEIIPSSEIIMITTTANAHKEIARKIAPYLQNEQIIVLNPGRTLGAVEFYNEIKKNTDKRIYIAEAQTLIYACRANTPGNVQIIGIKDKVLLAAYPSVNSDKIVEQLNDIYPCFIKATNILHTSLENFGAILHPSVMILNAGAIERGNMFYFYNDMTHTVANFIEQVDKERLAIGKAFGLNLLSVSEWISYAYKGIKGDNLLEKIRNNPAYYKILAPNSLKARMLIEDIPTGILPMIELARMCNIKTPLLNSILIISQSLLNIDFITTGRTLKNLNIEKISVSNFLNQL